MVILYSTEGCHLCEMAIDLLKKTRLSCPIEIIDIAFDECLFSRYGVTIPVLNYEGNELYWPFDLQQLQSWLDKNGITYDT